MTSSDSRITSSERRHGNYMEVFKRKAPEFPSRNSHLGVTHPPETSECSLRRKTKTETFAGQTWISNLSGEKGGTYLVDLRMFDAKGKSSKTSSPKWWFFTVMIYHGTIHKKSPNITNPSIGKPLHFRSLDFCVSCWPPNYLLMEYIPNNHLTCMSYPNDGIIYHMDVS